MLGFHFFDTPPMPQPPKLCQMLIKKFNVLCEKISNHIDLTYQPILPLTD